jgi:hypothetical protein
VGIPQGSIGEVDPSLWFQEITSLNGAISYQLSAVSRQLKP